MTEISSRSSNRAYRDSAGSSFDPFRRSLRLSQRSSINRPLRPSSPETDVTNYQGTPERRPGLSNRIRRKSESTYPVRLNDECLPKHCEVVLEKDKRKPRAYQRSISVCHPAHHPSNGPPGIFVLKPFFPQSQDAAIKATDQVDNVSEIVETNKLSVEEFCDMLHRIQMTDRRQSNIPFENDA